jgi:hypothetical protein
MEVHCFNEKETTRIEIPVLLYYILWMPITAAAKSKAWTDFARSNAGIVGSISTQGMDVCMCVYSVFVLFCV